MKKLEHFDGIVAICAVVLSPAVLILKKYCIQTKLQCTYFKAFLHFKPTGHFNPTYSRLLQPLIWWISMNTVKSWYLIQYLLLKLQLFRKWLVFFNHPNKCKKFYLQISINPQSWCFVGQGLLTCQHPLEKDPFSENLSPIRSELSVKIRTTETWAARDSCFGLMVWASTWKTMLGWIYKEVHHLVCPCIAICL